MTTLYKRNAQGKPLFWNASEYAGVINITHGLVGGTQHKETIQITSKKGNELQSRIKAKRKEGYKELSELKDSGISQEVFDSSNIHAKIQYLNTYLPKYSTTSEGFVLPMLAKVLKDNKPFEKYGTMLGQWKINGLRCIIGATDKSDDLFNPVILTYHSRTGEDWTPKMKWMDEILLPKISKELLDMMIEEDACLDGELYLPGYSINDIDSFVKNTQLENHYKLQYWCYDICCENMSAQQRDNIRQKQIYVPYLDVMCKETHLNNNKQFVILPTVYNIENISDALFLRNKFIDYGFEGLILRNPSAEYQFDKRNQAMFKFKKIDDGKFEIIDIISEGKKRKNLGKLVLKNDINDELFECTYNASHDAQEEILVNKNKYIGNYFALVEFRERSGKAEVPFHAKTIKLLKK